MTYHSGELAVQARAGVQAMAARIGRGIRNVIPPIGQAFIQDQIMAIAASVDGDGNVWASLLMDLPGFLHAPDDQHVHIHTAAGRADPLADNLTQNPHLGLIVIDLATSQRVRLNGTIHVQSDGLLLTIDEAYSNCQKYIQSRAPHYVQRPTPTVHHNTQLTDDQQNWIVRADTFFIASYHPDSGTDASHRGGNPGFVHIVNPTTLEFPDYAGNMMFNTLGNLHAYPRAGLLFLDFENGSTLQLSGEATIIWDSGRLAPFSGAERIIEYRISHVIETTNVMPFTFDAPEPSPANP